MVDRRNSSKESMKNIMEVVQERNLGRGWNKMVWYMPIKRPEKKRKTKYNKRRKNNRMQKGEGSGEWSHPEDLSTYSVMDMCSSHCARKRTFNQSLKFSFSRRPVRSEKHRSACKRASIASALQQAANMRFEWESHIIKTACSVMDMRLVHFLDCFV